MRTIVILLAFLPFAVLAAPERLVYKTIGDAELGIHIYNPKGWKAGDERPAIVFFHGGGWRGGTPKQFEPHCKHFADRGMVAMTVEYRLTNKHGSNPIDSTRDAKSALRWVRAHAEKLGIDPNRIAAGGGSAGGHLAAAIATIDDVNEETDDLTISSVPNALILFNPALDLGIPRVRETRGEAMAEKMLAISPHQHVTGNLPPTIIFHGTTDPIVPYHTAEDFAKKATGLGSKVILKGYNGRGHGFFNQGRGDGKDYESTLSEADEFLVELGWLEAAEN